MTPSRTPVRAGFAAHTLASRAAERASGLLRRASVVAAVAVLLSAAATSVLRAQEAGIALGATAPDAAVVTLDGRPAKLSQFLGRTPVVLEFWATWCPLCRKLEPSMSAARERYAGRVTFVSVGVSSNQTAKRQKAYVEKQRLGGEFVFDRDDAAVAAYRVPHTSYVVLIDGTGKVVYTGVGGDQDIPQAIAKAFASSLGGGR